MYKSNSVIKYAEHYTSDPGDLLLRLERETYLQTMAPQMISGKLQGRFLSMISKLMQPKLVLEVGTFTGYGAICLAEGLKRGGQVHTIELNAEFEQPIRRNIEMVGYTDLITLHMGEAQNIIPTMEDAFDLIFIDAGKRHYSLFYDLVFDKVRKGGCILTDNVLWGGKVLQESGDEETLSIKCFNDKVQNDPRVENLLLPLTDGMMVCRKK